MVELLSYKLYFIKVDCVALVLFNPTKFVDISSKLFVRVTGGELFDRIVEKGSYSEKDAADLIKQVTFQFKA